MPYNQEPRAAPKADEVEATALLDALIRALNSCHAIAHCDNCGIFYRASDSCEAEDEGREILVCLDCAANWDGPEEARA